MSRKYSAVTLVALTLIGLFMGKAYVDTNTIEVKKYQISHPSLGEVLAGLKVAHLSDLHIKRTTDWGKKILEILGHEKPDLILLTGDYIKFNGSYEPALSFFRQLKAPFGVYAVMGNTEYYNENGSCILCHKEGSRQLRDTPNPIFLKNSHVDLSINGKIITLLGVDDPVNKRDDLKQALKGVSPNNPAVLLAHSPEIFSKASDLGIDLVLSGHTHGGQLFLVRVLRKIFPLDQTLDFLDGFFQEGKTVMVVNRGIGTSFLPFRFGVKPEIAFFECKNPTSQPVPGGFQIFNTSSKDIFAGFDFSSFFETFNLLDFIKNKLANSRNSGEAPLLFDFESPAELQRLNWECHKWFELSTDHATSGKYSLKASFPPGQYPGINFKAIARDWSRYAHLKMDIFNPSKEDVLFHIRIDDHKSGWEYADRFDRNVTLKPGRNAISLPTSSIKTNLDQRLLNLEKIERMMIFIPNNLKPRDLYFDNIRLN
jgi:hypothetical protein